MADSLARGELRLVPGRSAAPRLVGLGGAALTAGIASAAAFAGLPQEVRLPHWWGSQTWRTGSPVRGYVLIGVVLLGALCLLWTRLAAGVLVPRSDPPLRRIAAMAVLWAVPFAVGGPVGSLDVHSYAAVGRLAAIGLDPYQATPGLLGDGYSAAVDPLWRWTPTPYGPLQVQLLRGLVRVAGTHVGTAVLLIRAVAVLAAAAAVLLALRSARLADRGAVLVVTALNPVLLVHVVSGAHLDALVGLLTLAVVGLARRERPAAAMVLALVTCAVKLPGAVLVAYVLLDVARRTPAPARPRALLRTAGSGLATTAVIAAVCPDPFGWVPALDVPGLVHDGIAPSTWVSYLLGALTGHLSGPALDTAFTAGRILTGALGVALVVALLCRATSGSSGQAFSAVGWALIALAVTGPSLYPWYLTWGLFAAAVGGGRRGRLVLVALSSAVCAAAALDPGWQVLVVWLAVLLAVLGLTAWWFGPGFARRSAAPLDPLPASGMVLSTSTTGNSP